MCNQRFSSIWEAIEDCPRDVEEMKSRSSLMMSLKASLSRISADEAVKTLGINQQRVLDLMGGKISSFSLHELSRLVALAGISSKRSAVQLSVGDLSKEG